MILNFLVIIGILVCAAVWGSKGKGFGLFSAFLALVCTITAGGIAFAAWEPVALALLNLSKDGASFFDSLLQDSAWTLGLVGPFLISLLILRLLVDSLVKKNLAFSENANTIGGLVIGALIGALTMGILVTGAGFLRLSPSLLGYQPVEEKQGSPIYTRSLWIPVDKLTVGLYEKLSTGAFASSTPLAHARPRAFEQAGMQRLTFRGQARVSIAPDQFKVAGRYLIEGDAEALLKDSFLNRRQAALYPDESAPVGPSTLVGYVVSFDSGAKEKGGVFVITPGQIRLISERDGKFFPIHPVAVIAQSEAGKNVLYRFRFDASEAFISSIGGGSASVFAFEFILPPNTTPVDLLIKNTRSPVGPDSGLAEKVFRTTLDRDAAVRDGSILTALGGSIGGGGPLDTTGSTRVGVTDGRVNGINTGNIFPGGATLNRTNRGPLTLNEEGQLVDGEHQFAKTQMNERGLDRNLRLDSFASTKDTTVVQVTLSEEGTRTAFGRAVEALESDQAPMLIDSNGARYEPIGYYYSEGEIVRIRFTPGKPIRSLSEAPTLSRTKRDQTLIFIYRPTKGVKITSFASGQKELISFGSGFETK